MCSPHAPLLLAQCYLEIRRAVIILHGISAISLEFIPSPLDETCQNILDGFSCFLCLCLKEAHVLLTDKR